jgi:hypothetical protein
MRKSNSSIPTLIIAFLCIAVYAAALIIGVYRLYVNVTDRRVIAEREFYDLADLASAAGVLGFMDTPFQEAIRDGLAKSQTLDGVIISGPSGEYAFERERGAVVRWEGDSPRFIRRFGLSATSVVPLRINGLRNVNISAGFRSVDYDYGITILKHSLIVILAALAVAFLTLLVESALSKDQVPAGRGRRNSRLSGYDDDEEPENEFDGESGEAEETAGYGAKKRGKEVSGSYREQGRESPEAWAQETSFQETGLSENLDFSDIAGFVPEPDFTGGSAGAAEEFGLPEADFSFEDYPQEEPLPAEPAAFVPPFGQEEESRPDVPQGLYTPRSGIGWEDYTRDRLESELHRCASFEQDLGLMVIAFSETKGVTDVQYKQLADMTVDFFNLRDLIFEKGEWEITVILPNTDLDQSFAKAEDFHNRLTAGFPGISDFRIGLSARSGRLVDADRLYFEASEALNKALYDPVSPIVAFKSDPEKYRAFLRSRGK